MFEYCTGLASVTIGFGVSRVGDQAFNSCTRLAGVYFSGNAPIAGENVFTNGADTIIYYLSGTMGWSNTWGGRPTVMITPHALAVTPANRSVGFAAGTTTFAISNAGSGTMRYTASESASWLNISSGGSGTNWGTIAIAYVANPFTSARTGTITIVATGASGSPISVKVIQAGGDAYEPDNSLSAAKPIANGQTQIRSINAAANTDYARFSVGGLGARNVRLETAGTSGDTQLWLYKGNGSLVAYNDNGGVGNFSRIVVASLAPGTYYVRIREYGNNGVIPFYTLAASWTAASQLVDAYEPDDVSSSAKPIANGQTQRRSIHVARNTDWAKFTVGSRGALNLRLDTSGTSGDTQMWLYNSAGTRLNYDDNSGVGRFSRITRSSLARGTYYIRIREYGNNGRIAAYKLKASWTSP
jgi:hypothetical protein